MIRSLVDVAPQLFALFLLAAILVLLVLSLVSLGRPQPNRAARRAIRPLGSAEVLVRLLGADAKPTRIEELPNGRALYFDIPASRLPLIQRYAVVMEKLAGRIVPNLVKVVAGAAVTDGGVPVKTQLVVFQVSLTPASVATIVCTEQSLTVTGVLAGDILVYASNSVASATNSLAVTGHVSAANTIALGYCNPTAAPVTPTPGTYNVVVLRG